MNRVGQLKRQQGLITIGVAMIMLLLITLMVITAVSLSTTNLRAVGNVQARNEAIAAANQVIEEIVETEDAALPAFTDTKPIDFFVDINDDLTNDYTVNVRVPVCVRATRANTVTTSSVTLPGFSAGDAWNTVWEITAVATQESSGTSVTVVHGVRYLMTEVQKNLVCG